MTCAEFDDIVEAIVAGDVVESDAARAHRAACARCAAAFAAAQAVERALAARPVAAPPVRFNAMVMGRIRSERWRADQQVDRVFNIAVTAGVIGIVLGGLALVNLASVTTAIVSMASVTADALSRPPAARAESLPMWIYALAGALLAASALIWRWAEGARQQPERVRP